MVDTSIWITWERQRRSLELARRLGCRLHVLLVEAPYLLRAIKLGARTCKLLAARPQVVYVQNPSILLATLAVFLRPMFGYVLVVDRHSNFKQHTLRSRHPQWLVFHALSRYTVKHADLTIVTNTSLAEIVQSWGGKPFVLPDPLPHLEYAERRDLGEPTVVCVSSFGTDEPIGEVLGAARIVGPQVRVVITGNPAKLPAEIRALAPENVRFSGYLAEREFQSLLASCDAIMALTTQPHTLLCAAYEAVSLGQPLIVSDQEDLRSYFYRGAVSTANTAQDIADAIETAISERVRLAIEARALAMELEAAWKGRFANLSSAVEELIRSR